MRRRKSVTSFPGGNYKAFTLIELVVSIGILVLMLAMVGFVFKLSITSTSQAERLTDLNRAARLFEATLRRDLAGINPGRSLLVIRAKEVNAWWTAIDRDTVNGTPTNNYYPTNPDPPRERPDGTLQLTRGDQLMFFNSGNFTSAVTDDPANPGQRVVGNVQLVVYGHADLGTFDASGAMTNRRTIPPGDVNASPLPGRPSNTDLNVAAEWHLSRRTTIVGGQLEQNVNTPSARYCGDLGLDPSRNLDPMGFRRLLIGEFDVLSSDFQLQDAVSSFYNPTSWQFAALSRVDDWLERSQIDPNPPPSFSNRLHQYFLPGCASFKVEWTVTDHQMAGATDQGVIWHDPADPPVDESNPALVLQAFPEVALMSDPTERMQFLGRFNTAVPANTTGTIDPQTAVWYSRDVAGLTPMQWTSGMIPTEPDPFWPRALRITLDLFDANARMERPIRYVMIIPVGRAE